jgi:23S rRNA pseudouridine955/2504/2580 synthase
MNYMPVFKTRGIDNALVAHMIKEETGLNKPAIQWVEVTAAHDGQRLDNFLIRLCKGVPKSHLYKAVRGGQVRVNKGRTAVDYRIQVGDVVRIPPFRMPQPSERIHRAPAKVFKVVYEDEGLLVIDKPPGVAVHGGSGVSFGVIESLRAARPELAFLELVHRLDRDTSGLLMLAKRRQTLLALHQRMRDGQVTKHYVALVKGRFLNDRQHIKLGLTKWTTVSGERRVKVDPDGQSAHTVVTCLTRLTDYSLLDAELRTGRTHQIRVHLAALGHSIVGDDKYGDDQTRDFFKQNGLARMFLHARSLSFNHPATNEALTLEAPLPDMFDQAMVFIQESKVKSQ